MGDDQYITIESLEKQVAALSHGEDLYMDVETFKNSLDQLATVEDVYICVDSLPDEQSSKAKQLVQQYINEDIYAKPPEAPGEWYTEAAKKLALSCEPWYYGAVPRDKAERLVLDQTKGRFLVRVSIGKNKLSYAITVAMGKLQFMHISVPLTHDGKVSVDGVVFPNIREVVKHFTVNEYKKVIKLAGPIVPKSRRVPPTEGSAPAPPPRSARNREPELPPVPPRSPASSPKSTGSHRFDFESDYIYASTISDDDDNGNYEEPDTHLYEEPDSHLYADAGDYEEPVPVAQQVGKVAPLAKTNAVPAAGDSIKRKPLPADVSKWSTDEVQRWLKAVGLGEFRKPCYANGINGVALLNLSGSIFPASRYNKAQCGKLDAALATLRKRHKPSPLRRSSRSDEDDLPPLPPLPSRPSQRRSAPARAGSDDFDF